jgi:hypothetical protein
MPKPKIISEKFLNLLSNVRRNLSTGSNISKVSLVVQGVGFSGGCGVKKKSRSKMQKIFKKKKKNQSVISKNVPIKYFVYLHHLDLFSRQRQRTKLDLAFSTIHNSNIEFGIQFNFGKDLFCDQNGVFFFSFLKKCSISVSIFKLIS